MAESLTVNQDYVGSTPTLAAYNGENMFNKTGTTVIEEALGSFTKLQEKLAAGIAKCQDHVDSNNDSILDLRKRNEVHLDAMSKARRAAIGIERLLSGE